MTTYIEGERSFFLGAQASLIVEDREIASTWAQKYVLPNPAHRFLLGRFVEADKANNNRQLFSLKGLQVARPTIQHAPMNMNHSSKRVVGAFVATDLIYPTDQASEEARGSAPKCPLCNDGMNMSKTDVWCAKCEPEKNAPAAALARVEDAALNPFIEALGVFWRHYFREDYAAVEEANAQGRLYFSMECIPQQIQCAGDEGCGSTFQYAGRQSDTYCAHLNECASDKHLIHPHFTAGAVLVPPVRPGWSHADVKTLVAAHSELANDIYNGVKADLSHLDSDAWEALMGQLLELSQRH